MMPPDQDVVKLMADMLVAARMQKAAFDAYLEAGFTEQQALNLTAELIRTTRPE